LTDRIDVFIHQPSYHHLRETLKEKEKQKTCALKGLADFKKIENLDAGESEDKKRYKYIEIGSIDAERGFIIPGEWDEGTRDELADRAKLPIKENDVLFSKPFRSLRKIVIIPKELDGQLASSGFYGIRPNDYGEACLLWAIFRSPLVQKQLIHLSSGYTQRELNEEYLKEWLLIPIPSNKAEMSKNIKQEIETAKKSRAQEIASLNNILNSPMSILK
jgi:type I restriction enzyme S subunit